MPRRTSRPASGNFELEETKEHDQEVDVEKGGFSLYIKVSGDKKMLGLEIHISEKYPLDEPV